MGDSRRVAYDGWDPAGLAARVRTPSLVCLSEVTSTLDVVHELAGQGAPAGTAVVADRQTSGRGRQGREWSSPPGQGIWLGYLLRPAAPLETGVVALRVGLAVAETLDACGAAARLKWPNDVLVSDRKIAGVLCEVRWTGARPGWVAVGIGVNVHGPLAGELRDRAIALDEVVTATRVDVLDGLLGRLRGLSVAGTLDDRERAAIAARDWLQGRALREPVGGIARGVDVDGALLVETAEGMQRVHGGTVRVG